MGKRLSLANCRVARAVFDWAERVGLLWPRERQALLQGVARSERAVYACMGKQFFDRYVLARRVGVRGNRKGHVRTPYQCPACGGWHLTTMNDRPDALRRRKGRPGFMQRMGEFEYA